MKLFPSLRRSKQHKFDVTISVTLKRALRCSLDLRAHSFGDHTICSRGNVWTKSAADSEVTESLLGGKQNGKVPVNSKYDRDLRCAIDLTTRACVVVLSITNGKTQRRKILGNLKTVRARLMASPTLAASLAEFFFVYLVF